MNGRVTAKNSQDAVCVSPSAGLPPILTDGWVVEPEWLGKTVLCLGSGPSLTETDIAYAMARVDHTVAINTTGRIAPSADLLYYCDAKWWRWHGDEPWVRAFQARNAIVKGSLHDKERSDETGIRNIALTKPNGLEASPDRLAHGRNSGYAVINLMAHLGAKRNILLGYDMGFKASGDSHWHGSHPTAQKPSVYSVMLKEWPSIVEPLKARGIEVINCTPASALQVFPRMRLREALS